MAFAKSAVALLSLLTIANAEPSLQAHKASGGGLHVVGLASCYAGGNPGTPCFNNTAQFIYQTNGNGTWYNASSSNSAFLAAAAATGSLSGLTGGLPGLGSNAQGLNAVAFPSQTLGVLVGASTPQAAFPSILTSVDLGLTWQKVTGFGGAAPSGFAAANNTAPDLNAVFAVSRSLIFAAGGYQPIPSTYNAQYNIGQAQPGTQVVTGSGGLAFIAGLVDTNGAIYTSINGGTVWNSVALPSGTGSIYGIAADASGKHVYAVGTPSTLVAPGSITSIASPYNVFGGCILYSGNYGQTWTAQAAPIVPSYTYQLTSVAVLRGTLAYAAGGSPYSEFAQVPDNGIIVGTANGGFSWLQQPIAGPSGFGQANGTIPYVNSIAFNLVGGMYQGWAVGGFHNYTSNVSVPMLLKATAMTPTTMHNAQATYLATQWTAQPVGNFPAAQLTSIVWDNNHVGYIFGQGVILSTHDAGTTWYSETPAGLVLASVEVVSAAPVPTTY